MWVSQINLEAQLTPNCIRRLQMLQMSLTVMMVTANPGANRNIEGLFSYTSYDCGFTRKPDFFSRLGRLYLK